MKPTHAHIERWYTALHEGGEAWPSLRGRRTRAGHEAKLHIGTCGWHYAEWRGTFYEEKTKPEEELAAYAGAFDIVEVDSTFYGIPAESAVLQWRQRTPEHFLFTAKLPRSITHEARLVDAIDELDAFCDVMRLLGPKLAAILIQLPPSFTVRAMDELDEFLDVLPTDMRFAIEVRHRSWIVPETFKLLRHHRVAWAISDLKEFPIIPAVTADFAYIRWLGSRDDVKEARLETLDRTADLLQWRDLLRELRTQVRVIYGFFNNHYTGHAPRAAMTFKEMLGLPVVRRERWQQASLLEGLG